MMILNMGEAELSDHPMRLIEQLKNSFKSKVSERDQYSFYLLESIIRACDELYQYCLLYMNSALCQEMVNILQSIAYDFVALNEWFKLKSVCKDLPPPARTSVAPSQVSHHLKKLSRTRSFRRAKSEPRLNKVHTSVSDEKNCDESVSAGVNVSAPDFVPSYSSVNETESSWNQFAPENERNSYNELMMLNMDPKSVVQSQLYSGLSGDYIGSGRPLDANQLNQSYNQNVIPPNFWQYGAHFNLNPFQHPTMQIPHHYVPHVSHIPFPYSLYTNSMGAGNVYQVGPLANVLTEQMQCSINSGMSHTFAYSTNDACLESLDIPKNEPSEDIRPPSSFSDSSDIVIICEKETCSVQQSVNFPEKGELSCVDEKESIESSFKSISSEKTENICVGDEINKPHVTTLENFGISNENTEHSVKNTEHSVKNTEPIPPDKNNIKSATPLVAESLSQEKKILGLGEDECQIHFPELKPIYSQSRQKNRNRNTFKYIKGSSNEPSSSMNSAKYVINKSSNKVIPENIIKEKISFSKLFKTSSIAEKEPVRSYSSTNKKSAKSVNTQIPSTALKKVHNRPMKVMNKKTNKPIPSYVDDEDSDGWETVKVRSKWRDQTEFKQTRVNNRILHSQSNSASIQSGIRNHGKSSFESKAVQYSQCTVSNVLRSSDGDSSECAMKVCDSGEQVSEKITDDKTSKYKNRHVNCNNLNEKSLDIDKCIRKGRRNSSNFVHKNNGFSENQLSERNSVDKSETIDPKEMYTAYMQYINNVDEENHDTHFKQEKSILHPSAGGDIPRSVASLEQITDFVNRDPVKALEFKKKLNDEIRHQEDVKLRNEVKQQQAEKKRLEFLQCKTAKVREFVQKVEEVKAAQHQLALQRKSRIDLKLKKAEENRNMHLSIIKRKAHDEEEKLKEIAFINELEAQNRRHDSLALRQEHEERLQFLVEERQRRLEEKAAREAAVEERRRVLEAERQEKLEKMKEKRRRKQEIIDRKQQEREQERLEIAREKAREREERLLARQSAQLATVEELQKRIQQKQEQSARRHVECIELIRQKAVEIGLHRNTYENVTNYEEQIKGDVSNKDSDNHEKLKIFPRKRCRKIKSRMAIKGETYLKSFPFLEDSSIVGKEEQVLKRIIGKIESVTLHHVFLWQDEDCISIDNFLNETFNMFNTTPTLRNSFRHLNGYNLINLILPVFNNCTHSRLSVSTLKCLIKLVNLCEVTCVDDIEDCLYLILSNLLGLLLDSLKLAVKVVISSNKNWEILAEGLLKLVTIILESVDKIKEDQIKNIPDFQSRMHDVICYIMFSGPIAATADLFRASEIDEKFTHSSLIVPCIRFFGTLLSPKFKTDELLSTLKTTDLLGTVPLLYEGLMQHITKDGSLPEYSFPIISLFLKLARLDLKSFQDILGSESIALQWRGIASGLMMLCVRKKIYGELLHSVIKTVGYFAINNKKNQTLIQSGKHPSVLQQLVMLPFQYFCDSKYMEILFPTLIACSFQNETNKAIVENELNYSVLQKFMNSDVGKQNELVKLLNNQSDTNEI